mgnify:CR=1 FL=1
MLKKFFVFYLLKYKTNILELLFIEHHQVHTAAAYYPRSFNEAAILCIDGGGELAMTYALNAQYNT